EDLLNEALGDVLVEEVAHAIHEDGPGLLPGQGQAEAVRPDLEVEALFVGMAWDPTESLGKRLGVAVLAPGADLRAACDRVPRGIRPFDRACLAHGIALSS